MMTTNDIPYISSLAMIDQLKGYLTTEEELAFMQLLFSSSASIKGANYGLRRKELEKLLGIKNDDSALQSFIDRVNGALNRYFKIIHDERRDRVVVMMRITAKNAKSTLSSEALAILLYMFYQQEVLGHEFTLVHQILVDFGHESLNANRRMKSNIDQLKKVGAVEDYEASSEEAYQLTTIGVHLFSESFLRRTVEFAQETKLNKEEVMKFFNRYNLHVEEDKE
ncbi:hypothetical protein SAMN02787079_01116 [Lysinibacillus sp. TC-37]|nr:hypothetical protein SAMN02787078_00656 [Lysinibacillus sp. SG9]SDB14313.1 hypothetical protein SAMN02787079_01116 [Lysinibacillus sp. TC-37]SFS53426.1 hypothetical protein SAMN02787087_01120 [Lysinibacillus sp. SG55]